MSLLTPLERPYSKSLTSKCAQNLESIKRLKTLRDSNPAIRTELSIPEILLTSIPPNICPSFARKNPKTQTVRSKLSLLVDFGLATDKNWSSLAKTCSAKDFTHRTITISDFMGKKNVRMLTSSYDLRAVNDKLNKRDLIYGRKSKKSLTLARSPYKMDIEAKLKALQSQNCESPISPKGKQSRLASITEVSEGCDKIFTLNKIVSKCDMLLKDNQKALVSMKNSKGKRGKTTISGARNHKG